MSVWSSILAIVGSLGGTGLGAWLTARQAERDDRRQREDAERARRREVRAAARLVHSELGMTGLLLAEAAENSSLAVPRAAPTDACAVHGTLLAAELDDDEHLAVSEACTKIATLVAGACGPGVTSHAIDDASLLDRVRREVDAGQDALDGLAYPSLPVAARPEVG